MKYLLLFQEKNHLQAVIQMGVLGVTCLSCSYKSGVPLIVLPVNIQIRALRKSDDHVHIAIIARHNQARLKHKNKTP